MKMKAPKNTDKKIIPVILRVLADAGSYGLCTCALDPKVKFQLRDKVEENVFAEVSKRLGWSRLWLSERHLIERTDRNSWVLTQKGVLAARNAEDFDSLERIVSAFSARKLLCAHDA